MFSLIPSRRNSLLRTMDEILKLADTSFSSNVLSDIKVDIKEEDDFYIMEAELPGVNKEDVKINLDDKFLTISLEKDKNYEQEKENYIRRERSYGSFKRSFYLDDVDKSNIKAKMDKGILQIKLGKDKAISNKSKEIEIE